MCANNRDPESRPLVECLHKFNPECGRARVRRYRRVTIPEHTATEEIGPSCSSASTIIRFNGPGFNGVLGGNFVNRIRLIVQKKNLHNQSGLNENCQRNSVQGGSDSD